MISRLRGTAVARAGERLVLDVGGVGYSLAVTPTAHWLERMDLAGPILESSTEFADGNAICPVIPGIGIAWNEDAVAQHSVN